MKHINWVGLSAFILWIDSAYLYTDIAFEGKFVSTTSPVAAVFWLIMGATSYGAVAYIMTRMLQVRSFLRF